MPICRNDWPNGLLQLSKTFKVFPGSKADFGTDAARIVFTQSRGLGRVTDTRAESDAATEPSHVW